MLDFSALPISGDRSAVIFDRILNVVLPCESYIFCQFCEYIMGWDIDPTNCAITNNYVVLAALYKRAIDLAKILGHILKIRE